jgi:hypothetical protein
MVTLRDRGWNAGISAGETRDLLAIIGIQRRRREIATIGVDMQTYLEALCCVTHCLGIRQVLRLDINV